MKARITSAHITDKGILIRYGREYKKEMFCEKCGHIKERYRVAIGRIAYGCVCLGECGCFKCDLCQKVPCECIMPNRVTLEIGMFVQRIDNSKKV